MNTPHIDPCAGNFLCLHHSSPRYDIVMWETGSAPVDHRPNKPERHIGPKKGYLYIAFIFSVFYLVSKCVDMLIALNKRC